MLRYPIASAAAMVDPDPANGSRMIPFPNGNAALTNCRRKDCGFKLGWGANDRSDVLVGAD